MALSDGLEVSGMLLPDCSLSDSSLWFGEVSVSAVQLSLFLSSENGSMLGRVICKPKLAGECLPLVIFLF